MSFEIFRFSVLRPPELYEGAEIINLPPIPTNDDGIFLGLTSIMRGEHDGVLSIVDTNSRLDAALAVALSEGKIKVAEKIGLKILQQRQSDNNLLVVENSQMQTDIDLSLSDDLSLLDDLSETIEIQSHPAFRPVGVSDLYTIEQTLMCYEPSEISHIENVLTGEKRERRHEVLKETEITESEEIFSEFTDEHSLATEERFELNEAFKLATQSEMSLNTSLEAKASYGPTVEVKIGAQFGMTKAKQTARETASHYARTTTEKAVKTTVDRVSSTRTERRLTRTTHSNLHAFDNSMRDEHVLGVYQYLDKVYRCELLNHGPRFFYELIIPAPGKSLRPKPDKPDNVNTDSNIPPKPLPPKWKSTNDIEIKNFLKEFPHYEGGTPPESPPGRKIISTETFKNTDSGAKGAQNFALIGKIDIPDGYVTDHAIVQMLLYEKHKVAPGYHIRIGNAAKTIPKRNISRDLPEALGRPKDQVRLQDIRPYRGSISFAVNIVHDSRVVMAIDLVCEPAPEVLQEWRNSVYTQAWQNYRDAVEDWQRTQEPEDDFLFIEEVAEREDSLRARERTELKRQSIELISKMSEIFHRSGPVGRSPLIIEDSEFPDLGANNRLNTVNTDILGMFAQEVTFAETAFEWSGMMWELYPYYWQPKDNWNEILDISHPDREREEFMKAGAARVLLPIKPGFEEQVHAFLFKGPSALGIDSDFTLTSKNLSHLAAEIHEAKKRRRSKNEDGYPIKEDEWLARVPTELVALRTKSGLPTCSETQTDTSDESLIPDSDSDDYTSTESTS